MHALSVTNDYAAFHLIRRAFSELGVEMVHHDNVDTAFAALASNKFDAVVVDCDDMIGAREVLLELRKLPSNRRSIVFAMINGVTNVQQAFELGANFVLNKPLTGDRIRRSVRAAHGLISNERRRYYRCPTSSIVSLQLGDAQSPTTVEMVNLSEGGMAVRTAQPLAVETPVRFSFKLPLGTKPIEGKGAVAWSSPGLCGVTFLYLSRTQKDEIQQYIAARYEQDAAGEGALAGTPANAHRM